MMGQCVSTHCMTSTPTKCRALPCLRAGQEFQPKTRLFEAAVGINDGQDGKSVFVERKRPWVGVLRRSSKFMV